MNYLGDYADNETVHVWWSSNSKDGASITRATNGSIVIFKNNSATQKVTVNGVTDSEDFDSITGVHLITIDTSNDTGDAGFWATGNDYAVVLSGATIDGETVNHVLATFSIENRFMRGTNGANTTAPLSAAQVNAEVDTALADYDAPTKAELDAGLAALNDLSAAQVNAEVDTALADYDAPTKAELDAGLAALNDLSAAQVNAEVDTALADYDAPTKAELDAGLAALNDLSAAQVNAEVDTALADYDAPTKAELDASESSIIAAMPAAAPTAAAVADAVWDEAKAGHTTSGSFGEEVQSHALSSEVGGGGGDATAANQATIIADIAALNDLSAAQVNAEVDTALADYDAPTKAELDASESSIIAAMPAAAPTAAAVADAVWDEAKAGHTTSGSFGEEVQSHALSSEVGGGGGLTQQQVRDAMKLAPSAGSPADGSIDDHLDDLAGFTPAAGSIEVTDILIDLSGTPLEGADVWIATDAAGTNIVWRGTTNASGNPKDNANNNPWLDAGTYHIWVQHSSAQFPTLPISKVIS